MSQYPYLSGSVVLFSLATFLVLAAREHRRMLLISGALATPPAFFSWQFIPEYWDPPVLFRYVTTFEDLLFSASVGVIVTALALFPFRNRIRASYDWARVLRRYAICQAFVAILHVVLLHAVFRPHQVMYSATIAIGVFAVFLFTVRRETLPLAAVGLTVFPVFYFAVLQIWFKAFPASVDYWAPVAQLPFEVRGVPAFELVWAAFWGLIWPPFIWYACDVESIRTPRRA